MQFPKYDVYVALDGKHYLIIETFLCFDGVRSRVCSGRYRSLEEAASFIAMAKERLHDQK